MFLVCIRQLLGARTLFLVVLVTAATIGPSRAQLPGSELHVNESALRDVPADVADEIRLVQSLTRSREERLEMLAALLSHDHLPSDIRKKLSMQAAKITTHEEALAIYDRLLLTSTRQENADVRRALIDRLMLIYDNRPSSAERIKKLNGVVTPLLGVPSNEWNFETTRALVSYVRAMKQYSRELAGEIRHTNDTNHALTDLVAAQTELGYAEDIKFLLIEVLAAIDRIIAEYGVVAPSDRSKSPEEYVRLGIEHELEQIDKRIDALNKSIRTHQQAE